VLTLLLGGARSGKSALAVRLASLVPVPATFIATGEALDDEMAERIAQHRAGRPASWPTVEEAVELERALAAIDSTTPTVIDCLTLWVANLLGAGRTDADVLHGARQVAALAARRVSRVIAVSNEVGSGIVPADVLSRRYRDLLGRVNTIFSDHAQEAFLVIAGRAVPLVPVESMAPLVPGVVPGPASEVPAL
jgi:adenosyl cobinamide kinase/adenosyl cobinamide phosphate guanylyltransferase